MIISLSGRKQSGKTVLANVAAKHGFIRKSWATPLKDLVGKLLNCSYQSLQDDKNKLINFLFSSDHEKIISQETGFSVKEIHPLCSGKCLKTVRDLMQFLGTDVIRLLDANWHIKKIEKELSEHENYVFDDTRFLNEKNFLQQKGAICFFILRPRNYDYDHHESEVSLRWTNFDDFIINNDKTTSILENRFGMFCNSIQKPMIKSSPFFKDFKTKVELRNFLKPHVRTDDGVNLICKQYNVDRPTVFSWKNKLYLYRPLGLYEINDEAFSQADITSSYLAGLLCADGCIKDTVASNNVTLALDLMDECLVKKFVSFLKTDKPIQSKEHRISKNMIYCFATGNSFILENIKLWNLKPRKSEKEEIPWIIRDNVEMLKAWIVGLIDGDGSICFGQQSNKKWPNLKPSIRLQILSSKEVCEFLTKLIPIHHVVRNHKDTKLMEMSFLNFYALDFFNWLGKPNYGLNRKWSKLEEFKNLSTSRRTPKNEHSD